MPLFLEQRRNGRVTVTDPRMTRFWITLDEGVRFVAGCLQEMRGGEVFIPKIPSMRITDLIAAVAPGCAVDEIGIRPGEKLHEVLLAEDEARHAVELDDMYVVLPVHPWWRQESWSAGRPLAEGFRYSSDTNSSWLGSNDLPFTEEDS